MSRMGYGWVAHTVHFIERPTLATETPWTYSWICPYLAVNIGKSFYLHEPQLSHPQKNVMLARIDDIYIPSSFNTRRS